MAKFVAYLLLMSSVFYSGLCIAQDDTTIVRKHILELASKKYAGRGYAQDGMRKAANYIAEEYQKIGLKPIKGSFYQDFKIPIVQFEGDMNVEINGKILEPGIDYLVDPFSASFRIKTKSIKVIDFATIATGKDSLSKVRAYKRVLDDLDNKQSVFVLLNTDTLKAVMGWKGIRALSANLPQGKYVVPLASKPLWFPAQEYRAPHIIYIYDDYAKNAANIKSVNITVASHLDKQYEVSNVVGYVPANRETDSFVVITAHYDHIGMMGREAMFAGASDNASGTAMMLNLAKYYQANPANYNILFIACAAEEAGLLGAYYYANHPLLPLKDIRFLVNLDIWGDATNGVAVVNGKIFEKEFEYVVNANMQIGNNGVGFFKEIRKGNEAKNSDHAPFYEKGVPAFFFYTMGGPGHYHHVADKAETLKLTNINEAAELVRLFIRQL